MTKLFEDPPATISSHWAHRRGHKLELLRTGGGPFRCDGCRELGDGPRYRCACEPCNFDLHVFCALAKATLDHHLFPAGCEFVLYQTPPAPAGLRQCDACGGGVGGMVYHCADRDLDVHPCCAALRRRLLVGVHIFELCKEASSRCSVCGDKCSCFWFYRTHVDGEEVYLHVACFKDVARQVWEAGGDGVGGGTIMQASGRIMEGVLQNLPKRRKKGDGFELFLKIVGGGVRVIVGLIFGDPTAMLALAGAVFS